MQRVDSHTLSEAQRKAVADHVVRRRRHLNLLIREAAVAAELSERKWRQVEAGTHNHQERTLRLVAKGLGESPKRILELAGYSYDDALNGPQYETLQGLVQRIERLEPLPRELAALRAEVTDLVQVVRSVHHASESRGT